MERTMTTLFNAPPQLQDTHEQHKDDDEPTKRGGLLASKDSRTRIKVVRKEQKKRVLVFDTIR